LARHDDFFELGGHSLLATQAVSRIRREFDIELPLAALFDRPTVRGLAELVSGAETADADTGPRPSHVLAPAPQPRDCPPPLSFAQQRLWFLDQFEPGSPAYAIPMPIRLPGDLDIKALRAALNAVVARHEVLRTRIETENGVPRQLIDPPTPIPYT